MRGKDEQQLDVFSYVSPEHRVPQDHPLRPLRVLTDEAFRELQPRFHKLYAQTGRPSRAIVASRSLVISNSRAIRASPSSAERALASGRTAMSGSELAFRSASRSRSVLASVLVLVVWERMPCPPRRFSGPAARANSGSVDGLTSNFGDRRAGGGARSRC